MAIKRFIATIVSSREIGQRRRDEGQTRSSQIHTTTQGNLGKDRHTSEGGGRQKLKQVDGDFPACMRRENNNNEDKTRRNEDLKGKGGGRLKHCNVDGDVPPRSFDEEHKDNSSSSKKNSKERMMSGKSVSNSMKNDSRSKMTSGCKDLCGNTTEKKNQENGKAKGKDITFIVLQKNMRSIHSSERIEEMVCELEGY